MKNCPGEHEACVGAESHFMNRLCSSSRCELGTQASPRCLHDKHSCACFNQAFEQQHSSCKSPASPVLSGWKQEMGLIMSLPAQDVPLSFLTTGQQDSCPFSHRGGGSEITTPVRWEIRGPPSGMPASLHLLAQCLSRTRMAMHPGSVEGDRPSCSPCWLRGQVL